MEKLIHIAERLAANGITAYEVGGSVRNSNMGLPIGDIDICLVGVKNPSVMNGLFLDLVQDGTIEKITSEPVGSNFPNWTAFIDGQKVDFALARTEKKTGHSHQDFDVVVENVTIYDDLFRRDLTINAIAKDILTGEIIDPFNGREHIEQKLLRHVSDAFEDDALRVIRAARFYSYFSFELSGQLISKCISMSPEHISKERIGMELKKVMENAKKPSLFFEFLRGVGWLEKVFPELYACIDVPQSVKHHPEGDVFTHLMHTMDHATDWFERTVMLCHDLGKATTTEVEGIGLIEWLAYHGQPSFMHKVSSHGHEEAGVPLTMSMLGRIHFASGDIRTKIAMLVRLHMIRTVISKDNYVKMVRRTVRSLMSVDLKYIDLVHIVHHDLCGRPPLPKPEREKIAQELFYDYANFLENSNEMIPIVTGRKLIGLGMKPSPEIGKIVTKALELQDRGTLKEDNWKKVLKGSGFEFFKDIDVSE